MQRTARYLLWMGLALIVAGLGACGFGCLGAVAGVSEAVAGENSDQTMEVVANSAVFSLVSLAVGMAMVIVGAILKALAPKSREPD